MIFNMLGAPSTDSLSTLQSGITCYSFIHI
uniref:Uncharacterized protein n=1 Tax=Anguilla anguilla TaxID=7936 RepID=A0A0E9R149_ANGAN